KGDFFQIDGDLYAEERRDLIKQLAAERGYEGDIRDLPDDIYNRLYDEADRRLEENEYIWYGVEGVTINGEPQGEE
ncbi:MAG TPA: hypothetical protein VFA10_18650, partial [Ktedonobacteraceae bacterium]|nr:hypothetical protein [Ktedonobacteraceae bacterium]